MTASIRRRLGFLAACAAILAVPGVLWAHAHLVKSTPSANAQLATSPTAIHLWFSEAPELAFTRVILLAPDSAHVPLDSVVKDAQSSMAVMVPIPGSLAPGRYTVVWRTAAADGHPSSGRIAFTVLPGATAANHTRRDTATQHASSAATRSPTIPPAAPASQRSDQTFNASSPSYVIVRWLSFTTLLALIGVTAFHWLVLGALRRHGGMHAAFAESASRRAASAGMGASIFLGLASVARLYAQLAAMNDMPEMTHEMSAGTILLHTVWGTGWIAQLSLVIVAFGGFAMARRASRAGWTVSLIAAMLLAFTPAFAGHAVGAPRFTTIAILADGLHVLGAGGWLGSLLVVVAVGMPVALTLDANDRGPSVAALVNSFSPLALGFASLVAASGLVSAWLHLEHVRALWQSDYGLVLLIKLGVLSLVVLTGAYNWLRVRPSLGDAQGAVRIRRSATAELLIGAVVLAVTAILTATPTPADQTTDAQVRSSDVAPAVAPRPLRLDLD
ncbi:MAG: copper resistance protein CopC/CopD [Gemmatimonadaceae bacterium]|nr:copper resistance protein CopC/CopD [Gemmatimonadaceae bacterium]